MKSILIKNGRVWDGERFRTADVLTEGERVIRIDETIEETATYTFDAAGKIVSAGLVDLHVHLKGVSNDNIGIQAEMSSFPFGVTAAVDCGAGQGDKKFLNSLAVKNLVFVTAKCRDGQCDFATVEAALQRYEEKAVGLKVYYDSNIKSCPSADGLREICAYAREKGLKVMVHCSNSPAPMAEIVETLHASDILTHIYHGGEHTCLDDNFAALHAARKKGIVLDAGFAGHVHTNLGIFTRAVEAGVLPDTISTDITSNSAYIRGGRYGMTACMSIARTAGMGEEDIFRAVTTASAAAVGMDWGTLREGGCADIAVFEDTNEGFDLTDRWGNSMQSNTGYRCVLTVADGQVVYRH